MNFEILIIDDDMINNKILMRSFSRIGYTSIKCFNQTSDFLKYLYDPNSTLPKVVIMDYYMPLLNGFQLLAYLKRSSHLSGIKVILYSGSAGEHEKRISLKAGALDFVQKNYNGSVLTEFTSEVVSLVNTGKYNFHVDLVEN